MRKIKIAGVKCLEYRFKEFFNSLHDKDKEVAVEVEIPVSNQELCTEIRKNIDYLNNLIKVANKRNIRVAKKVGLLALPIDIKKLEVDIYEIKRY